MAISAGVASIASIGIAAAGTAAKAQGQSNADNYQADVAQRNAQYGQVKADQTSAQMTMRLNQTLGNIDAIRAASHDDPTSPTGAAFRNQQEAIGTGQRATAVGNILAQSEQQESDASYLRSAGDSALLSGDIGAAGQIVGGIGQGLGNKNFGFSSLGGGKTNLQMMPDDI